MPKGAGPDGSRWCVYGYVCLCMWACGHVHANVGTCVCMCCLGGSCEVFFCLVSFSSPLLFFQLAPRLRSLNLGGIELQGMDEMGVAKGKNDTRDTRGGNTTTTDYTSSHHIPILMNEECPGVRARLRRQVWSPKQVDTQCPGGVSIV